MMATDYRRDPLWLRLAFLEREGGPSAAALHRLVERETGWTPDRVRAIIEEYRRFLFLAMRAGHAVAPPPAIERVWNLHIAHAPNYWEVLSQLITERPVAEPGSLASAPSTLASYRAIFEIDAPAERWGVTATRGKRSLLRRLWRKDS